MKSARLMAAALSLMVVVHTEPVSAQANSGGIASATVSATNIADGTSVSIAGAMGYRFNPMVALGIEFMFVPSWSFDGDLRYFGIFGRRDAQIGRFGGGITYRF